MKKVKSHISTKPCGMLGLCGKLSMDCIRIEPPKYTVISIRLCGRIEEMHRMRDLCKSLPHPGD
ncbi:MAG: hypothetical protein ACLUOI_32240 [Eisenbergiella sp.]